MLQKPLNDTHANLLLSTHTCNEKDIKEAMNAIESLDFVDGNIAMIRIED